MTRPLPHLPGTLTADQIRITGEHIAGQQLASGLIPWFRGHHGDPWDHIEAAMALTVLLRPLPSAIQDEPSHLAM